MALLWHSCEKAGFLKRCYVVDNSSTKGGAGGKGKNPRIGCLSLLTLQMKTDLRVRDPPKICQPPKYLSYPSNHSHMEDEIKSHGKIFFFNIMQCLDEKREGGTIRRKRRRRRRKKKTHLFPRV